MRRFKYMASNKMNNFLISVVLPVYNPGKHLVRCLDSLVNQTYSNLEIILIDDGSTDGSSLVCDEYAKNDKRIKCLHQKNQGVSAARNAGLAMARGDYIHFPDSDDYLEYNSYELLLDIIQKGNYDAVVFEYYVTYSNSEIRHLQPKDKYGCFDRSQTQIQLFTGFQFACTKFFKKELCENLLFREDIYRGEDTLFAAQALSRAERVLFSDYPLYHYVQSDNSACRGVFRENQLSILKLYDAYQELYREFPPEVYERLVTYLHDNLIGIYYQMYTDENKEQLASRRKEVQCYLKKYYPLAVKAIRGNFKRQCKFYLATYFPNFFCFVHRCIHKL